MIKRSRILALIYGFLLAVGGCAGLNDRSWSQLKFLNPRTMRSPSADPFTSRAEDAYAEALTLEEADDSGCVRAYTTACVQSWNSLAYCRDPESDLPSNHQLEVYRSSLSKLITTAQRYGRYDPVGGIQLSASERLPVRFTSMDWAPAELRRLEVVGTYRVPEGVRQHRKKGFGVPLLVHPETNRRYIADGTVCVATAVFKPSESIPEQFVVEIANTLRTQELSFAGHAIPLEVDTTAPLGYLEKHARRLGVSGLLNPSRAEQGGLQMIGPYRPGKIPVVFIHGLASDPLTWGSMANDLFVHHDILARFQFWTFSYPTGDPFPVEAARLRRQLVELRKDVDPMNRDVALDHIVLIGHSMGGLVAKMQVSSSTDKLFQSIASVPLVGLNLSQASKAKVASLFEFDPSEQVSRVIFIGTPHQGSSLANGIATQLASYLIKQPTEVEAVFEEVSRLNPGLLSRDIRRLPNSVDLLRPDNKLRQAIYELPVHPDVSLHSIIGVGHGGRWGREKSDGVVPYQSARHPGAESELTVDAGHSLHNHPDSTAEVVRILRIHAARFLCRQSTAEIQQANTVQTSQVIPPTGAFQVTQPVFRLPDITPSIYPE